MKRSVSESKDDLAKVAAGVLKNENVSKYEVRYDHLSCFDKRNTSSVDFLLFSDGAKNL